MITHEDVLEKRSTYDEYMKQFITKPLVHLVESHFTKKFLEQAWSEDKHFNGIYLSRWDTLADCNLHLFSYLKNQFEEAHEWNTLSVRVSILKRCAKYIVTGE